MFGFDKKDFRLGLNLFRMSVKDKYLGSSLGTFWAIANPLFMLALYTFVFGFVFKVRLPGAETSMGFAIWLISGYGPWMATMEAMMATTTSVTSASGLVKNMAFKTEILPISAAFVGLITLGVSLIFLLVLMTFAGNIPSWHVIWLPLIVALQFFLIVALGMWLSAINVFAKDLSLALPNVLIIIMFMTPIFYPMSSMPAPIQKLSFGNPFYHISDSYRAVILQHQNPNLAGLIYLFILALVIFYFGLIAFRKAKGYFDAAL